MTTDRDNGTKIDEGNDRQTERLTQRKKEMECGSILDHPTPCHRNVYPRVDTKHQQPVSFSLKVQTLTVSALTMLRAQYTAQPCHFGSRVNE